MAHQFVRMKRRLTIHEAPEIIEQNCLVFIESGYNKFANTIIADNIEYIKEKCKSMKLTGEKTPMEFVYLPDIVKNHTDEIRYCVPALNRDAEIPALQAKALAKYLKLDNIAPCFLRFEKWTYDLDPVFSITYFFCDDYSDAKEMIDDMFERFEKEDKRKQEEENKTEEQNMAFACNNTEDVSCDKASAVPDFWEAFKFRLKQENLKPHTPTADDAFDEETKKLIEEARDKINKLRLNGVSEWIIQQLALPQNELSRLVITKDFRIFLPDYNNMEIRMEPIVKSVFLLFLENENGIPFKCLSDYRERLTAIYNNVKEYANDGARLSNDRTWQTICNITNPLSNSINEKCTRIKEAFLSQFDEHLANRYYITGKRGEPKKITLPRELIDIQYEI